MKNEKKYVYYSDFGAIGDGITDDTEAIRAAHKYANECGGTVRATVGKNYLIRDISESIVIKTSCEWVGADFTIDNRGYGKGDPRCCAFFRIASDYNRIAR